MATFSCFYFIIIIKVIPGREDTRILEKIKVYIKATLNIGIIKDKNQYNQGIPRWRLF